MGIVAMAVGSQQGWPKMTKKLRVALDSIDNMLMDPQIGENLWAILSALRGPDGLDLGGDEPDLKRIFTGPMRSAAFPKWGAVEFKAGRNSYNKLGVVCSRDPLPSSLCLEATHAEDHFLTHIRCALQAFEMGDFGESDE